MANEYKLPNEILLLIKEFIPHSDLRTHVCFYNTCRTIAAFYGDNSDQATFWRRACLLSGVGWLRADSSWKEIAFETIAKDGFCTHPECGGALLEWNAKQVARAMHLYDWEPDDGPWDVLQDTETAWIHEDHPIPICNPVFKHLGFGEEPLPIWYTDLRDVYLRNDAATSWTPRQALAIDHPIAMRSFATFPSVAAMWLDFIQENHMTPNNIEGVTVWDVMRCVHSSLDYELSISALLRLLKGPFSEICADKHSTNFIDDLTRFSSERGLWAASRCRGLFFIRGDESGPVFSAMFSLSPEEESSRKAIRCLETHEGS